MSDKNALLAKEQAAMEKAIAAFNLKKRILDRIYDAPMPDSIYEFGYCANATLNYQNKEDLPAILAALPAMPCTYVEGDTVTVKPTAYLQPQDRGRQLVVYPLSITLSNGKSQVVWWTRLDDLDVQVVVAGADVAEVTLSMGDHANRFERDGFSYATGSTTLWLLRRKTVKDLPDVLSPYGVWSKSWDDWATSRDWNEKEKQYLFMAKAQVTSGQAFDVPYLREMLERDERHSGVFGRIGSLRLVLSSADIEDMLQFIENRQAAWPQMLDATQADLQRAREWFENFYATHGEPRSEGQGEMVNYLFRKETGLAGSVHLTSRLRPSDTIEVGFTLDAGMGRIREDATHIRVQCKINQDLPPIDWDALAEYF